MTRRRIVAVVVVDEEPDLRQLLCDILVDEGFDVLSLSRPTDALALDPIQKPALFLLDLMLPDMTGIELAHLLRRGSFADSAIIALSASPALLRRATESRLFDQTIHKPFDIDELLGWVRHYVA